MTSRTPLLIAYDGSPDARSAIETAAALFPGSRAVVLYARQPLEEVMPRREDAAMHGPGTGEERRPTDGR